jgi:xanthine dehydrogenase accessory factor
MKEMRSLLRSFKQTTFRSAALATLVKLEGSSYRRAGARLLWWPQGRVGSISGGCLEEDVIQHCQAVLRDGVARCVVYDTTDENDLVWGVGLGCNGIVRLLIERIDRAPPAFDALDQCWQRRESAVMAHVFTAADRPPLLGTLAAVGPAGALWSRSPGSPEHAPILAKAADVLRGRRSECHAFDLDGTGAEVFFEYLPPPLTLAVFGAGDDAQPLVRLASELGWDVSLYDSRPAFARSERFPEAKSVELLKPQDAGGLKFDDHTVAVVMTHHYLQDLPLLRALLPKSLRYLGLLGPKKRAEKILADLAKEGLAITDALRASLHAPVGLDLGGSGPEMVALSIVAEIQSILAQRDGHPLRQRERPIHG